MTSNPAIELTMDEIAGFLGDGGTGVLSLADDSTPYAIPVSYGYSPTGPRFYFRLGIGPDSEKQRYLAPDSAAQFVIYGGAGSDWVSVIARGRLNQIDPDDIDRTIADQLRRSDPPLYSLWTDPDAIEFHVYELSVTHITGRRTP